MEAASGRPSASRNLHLNTVSTVDAAANVLRELILDGELEPGSRLREAEFAERLGIARHSFRAATQVLISEGMLRREPHRGVQVTVLDAGDIVDTFRLRTALETEAVRIVIADRARPRRRPPGRRRALRGPRRRPVARRRRARHEVSPGDHRRRREPAICARLRRRRRRRSSSAWSSSALTTSVRPGRRRAHRAARRDRRRRPGPRRRALPPPPDRRGPNLSSALAAGEGTNPEEVIL